MKRVIFILLPVLVTILTADAASNESFDSTTSYIRNNDFSYASDGTMYTHYGNLTIDSNGTIYNHYGDLTTDSNGVIYNRYGNVTIDSNDNTYFHLDY